MPLDGDQERPLTRLADLQPMRKGGLGGAGAGAGGGRGKAIMSPTSWRANHQLWDCGAAGERGTISTGHLLYSTLLCSALLFYCTEDEGCVGSLACRCVPEAAVGP